METKYCIGFATQFYTLWSITQEYHYSQTGSGQYIATGYTTRYGYMGKLSKDQDKAVQKVKDRGFEKFGIDLTLRGTSSWSQRSEAYCKIPARDCSVFIYGKYEDQFILECSDHKYLEWYYEQTGNIYAKKVLLSTGNWVEYGEYFVRKETYQRMVSRERIQENMVDGAWIEVEVSRNLDGQGCMEYRVDGVYVCTLQFQAYERYEYNGYGYCLPYIGGKTKRIKGKTLMVQIENLDQDTWRVMECKFK
jgi:hypothetical protein